MMPKELKTPVQKDAGPQAGRFAAGEDPAKRGQILDGAKRVFMKMGFDAASMNDITREAGVSKGTIYVYFQNKEDLFVAMVEAEREAFLSSLRIILAGNENIEVGLYRFGIRFLEHMTDEKVVTAMRIVLGVRERMPALCSHFFRGPQNLRTVLHDYLQQHVESGDLAVDDLDLASGQFLDLVSGSFFKYRLFGTMPNAPSHAEIERVIRGAIRVFMAAYKAPDASVNAKSGEHA